MTFISTPDVLESLFEHAVEDVRDWAIEKAFDLYPDMHRRLISLVPSSSTSTDSMILHRFADLDTSVACPDPLLELIRGSARPEMKALSAALLIRSGYSLPDSEIGRLALGDYSGILASTELGFGRVLRSYLVSRGKNALIFRGIADACCFYDPFRDVIEAKDEKALGQRRDYFSRVWDCDIPRLERLNRDDILFLLEDTLAAMVPEDSVAWKRGLLAELEHDRARLATVCDVAKQRLPNWSREESRFLLACTLCLRRNKRCGDMLVEASNPVQLWQAVTLKPWRGVPGPALRKYLSSIRPEEVVSSLQNALSGEYVYASYAFQILNALGSPYRFGLFFDVLDGTKYGAALAEEAINAMRKAGEPAVQYILAKYPEMSPDQRTEILYVLDLFPTPQVVDFCLERFDDYLKGHEPGEFVSFLETIGARNFLAPLLQEWRAGEIGIGSAIKLISRIHGVKTEQIESVIVDTENGLRRPEDILAKPVSLFSLRCTKCGHTYHYEIKNIYVDEKSEPNIADVIQCKGCGSIETYEMTVHSELEFSAELLRVAALAQKSEETTVDTIDTPFKICEQFQMRVLGKQVKSTAEAYHVLKESIEQQPKNADLQKRMGNLLKNGGKPDLALPYYLEATRLDPLDAESCHFVIYILVKQGLYAEAIPHLERLIPLCRQGKMDEGLRRDIFTALLHQTEIIHGNTGHRVEIFQTAKPEDFSYSKEIVIDLRSFDISKPEEFESYYHLFRYGRLPDRTSWPKLTLEATNDPKPVPQLQNAAHGNKVGRNDPCPCGSGKKYKKCCGCQ